MSHVLGSETQSVTFAETGITYMPSGVAHAVDPDTLIDALKTRLAYAVCGTPVLVWSDPLTPFDPHGPNVHDACAAAVAAEG